jgi:OmpA-OmpF porin, OOP family
MVARIIAIASLVLALGAAPQVARAQDGASIDLNPFKPALDSRGYITVNASEVLGHQDVAFGLVTNWGYNLLRFRDGENEYKVSNLISPTLIGAFGLELGPLGLQLGASLPFNVMTGDRNPNFLGPPGSNISENFRFGSQGLGDLGLHTKVRLLSARSHPVGFGLVGSLYLPTASEDDAWLGESSVTPQFSAIVDKEFGRRVRVAANAGLRLRNEQTVFVDNATGDPTPPSTGQSMTVGNTLPFGVGASYAIVREEFDVLAEVFGALPLDGGENYFPLEAIVGAKFYLAQNSFLSFGGGLGFFPGEGGNPDFRSFIGIVFEPKVGSATIVSIPNQRIDCPDDPADYDYFLDQDCPGSMLTDNLLDGDGPCVGDDCPDGGGPGYEALDVEDPCPDAPAAYDGPLDEHGCPDRPSVIVTDTAIEILDKIHFEFDSARLRSDSFPILDQIAATMHSNPDITKIEIQGHTDERGRVAYNVDLSKRRARSVLEYLVEAGVEASRLTSEGYGPHQPIDPRSNEEAWARNRRVEFLIMERAGR